VEIKEIPTHLPKEFDQVFMVSALDGTGVNALKASDYFFANVHICIYYYYLFFSTFNVQVKLCVMLENPY